MENKLDEKEIIKDENNIIKEDKILLENKTERNIIKDELICKSDEENQINEENKKINNLNKSQILQDKLKKIFFERETNKYRYNRINIPDNLKYSSDNSNSSSPKRADDNSNIKNNKDVNTNDKINDNNNIQNFDEKNISKEILNNNNKEIINNKDKIINKEQEIKIETENKNENTKTNNKEKNDNNNIINSIENENNNIINKNKDINSNNYSNRIVNNNIGTNNKEINVLKINNINNFDKDNNDKDNNNDKDMDMDNNIQDKNSNNNVERNQGCKNYVIKRIPERKKNRNLNKINDEDVRNRTFSMGFMNHRRKNNSNRNNNDEGNISPKIIEKEEKDISDTIKNSNNNEKEENEEERNRRLYRLLMHKKLGSSHNIIKHNINQAINSNKTDFKKEKENEKNLEISEKSNKTQNFKLPKKEISEFLEEKKDITNNKDNEIFSKKENNKDISKTIKVNTSKEINAKEGALKILELIKAKKSEKNVIDQKKKETQEIIKKAKSQPIDITESNSTLVTKEEENNENKNNFSLTLNKVIQIKEEPKNGENEKNLDKNEEKIGKNENIDKKDENINKEVTKKIYRRFKGKSSLMGSNNLNIKNDFDSVVNDKLKNKNVKFNINPENENINNREFIKNEIKQDINEGDKINNNVNKLDNNGYKTEAEENKNNKIKNKINVLKNTENNLNLNSEEKLRRQKLVSDLAAEIKKDELSSRENKDNIEDTNKIKNISKTKFIGINRNHTTINISKKQYYIPSNSKKPVIQIKQPNNENANTISNLNQIKNNATHNIKELNLLQNQNDITTYESTNFNNQNISYNFFPNSKNKKYEQIKTYQNPKKSLENYSQKNINYNNISTKNKKINNIYEPKKCHLLSKEKTRIKNSLSNPFSPEISYSKNISNKKNKSPEGFTSNNNNNKMTYVKKNLSNISATKKDNSHRLNNSLGNIPSAFNNNFDINKIIKNKISTEIDSVELKNNLNSSFQMKMNLDKNKYKKGNIFNQEDDNDNNNNNVIYNLNSSYNNRFFQKNLSKSQKPNNLNDGYNTFYLNNKNKITKNYTNNLYISNNKYGNKNYDENDNYGTTNNNKNNNIKSIYSYGNKNNAKKRYENDNYNSINILNQINNNNIINTNYQINLYDSLKYEELLILEDKLICIMISLNNEKLISNECFDYWNYFFNCSLYENINKIFSNLDLENKKLIKNCLNYNLMSIILSYDTSFEPEKLDKIRPLLLEMLELCHKLLIITYEFILNITKNTNNVWIKKLYHLINSSKLSDGSETLFLESSKISEKEKMKYNINFLMQKIYYILYNYPSSFSQSYLMSLFKKINNKSYDDINDFFLEYILREKDIKYSILAYSFLKSGEILTPRPYPYLNYTSPKNYTLILDIDETLFHFKINDDDDEQGVLKIRPGVFQFIDEIKEYYEIILFSEAEKNYIELITDAVGDNRYLYDYILCRDYVTIVGQNFVKELSKIGRPLDKIIIIDNMPQNFSFNKENGIYIKSFWGEENDDKALIDLIPILVNIARSGKDVRKELVKYKEKIVTKISSNLYKHSNL